MGSSIYRPAKKSTYAPLPTLGPGSTTTSGYPVEPAVRPGTYDPAYGGIPGAVAMPNPYADLSAVYPNLSGANTQIASNIAAQLKGELSPETQAAIEDEGARFGVMSGMPGGNIASRRTAKNLGLASEALQSQGLKDYSAFVPTVSQTQTVNPALQAEIAAHNAQMAAAPVPSDAAGALRDWFNQGAGSFRGGGAGGGGGTRTTTSGLGGGLGGRASGSYPWQTSDPTSYPIFTGSTAGTASTPAVPDWANPWGASLTPTWGGGAPAGGGGGGGGGGGAGDVGGGYFDDLYNNLFGPPQSEPDDYVNLYTG
jgi:hypothetical protein